MQSTTLIYIVIAVLFSVLIAFFQYFYREKKVAKVTIILFFLRSISIFLLLLLLINPKIKNTSTNNIKPVLSVLLDNTLSIDFFKEKENVLNFIKKLKNHKKLNEKFTLNYYSFGEKLRVLDSLSFNENQTDIAEALYTVNELQEDKIGGVVLLSDGNQTIGNDYEFTGSKKTIYPVILGDTNRYKDVKISLLNVNKYSYINNKFPVEAMLLYEGKEKVSTQFIIKKEGKTVFTKNVTFSQKQNSKTITTNLLADKKGLQYYTAIVKQIANEKNTKNNYKSFSVEVLNEQQKVLVLTSILHPDLGVLKKAIESNKQREVEISLIDDFKNKLSDYQLVIFYQPNYRFKQLFEERKSNFLLITGTKTDWNFVNREFKELSKKAIHSNEDYTAVYNPNFLTFLQKDINFAEFPPLQDKFGTIDVQSTYQTLLQQKIKNIKTGQPLFMFFDANNIKKAALLGENIWKWRAASFLHKKSFEDFDEFIGNIVQYLSSKEKRNRLKVTVKRAYPANSTINISALYLDKNYQFDNRASLQLTVVNKKTNTKRVIPFSLINNAYQVTIEDLSTGLYSYIVSVTGQKIKKYGKFKILNYNVEQQFTSSNKDKLTKLALKTKGKLFTVDQVDELTKNILKNEKYYTVQKLTENEEDFINWKWILFLIVLLLSVEWFLRKYYGKI